MIVVSGKGVHSGLASSVRLFRDPGPVTFLRSGNRIPADHTSLSSTNRATSLRRGNAQVAMVEHLLAALYLRGWWRDLKIEVSADELPILDGSAAPWLPALDSLGPPPAAPAPLQLASSVTATAGDGRARLEPGADRLDVTISFDHPLIGVQRWQGPPDSYHELAAARTFGFIKDLDTLRGMGLARGAELANCLVYDDGGTLNDPRWPDEPVRHKALDTLGDLYLLGRPVAGTLRTSCGSHALHARLVREIRQHAGLETAS